MADNTMMRCLRIAGALALWVTLGATGSAQDTAQLYTCVDASAEAEAPLGVTLCDAEPTSTLTSRAEADNLQVRDGALVVSIKTNGISATAGILPGDLIYRIGGVDVENASAAIKELDRVETAADTVVNFLRGGRPYRVKLRRG